MPFTERYRPDPVFTRLGEGFYDVVKPAEFHRHAPRFFNARWAGRVGMGALDEAERELHLARLAPLPDNLGEALALRYHGHQFGTYNPQLGDGRGFLLAQLRDSRDGRLLDLGTKGSGRTPWSRGGDGRLTLKGGVREVLATEMLEALGVNTSKSFSLYETGEMLMRGDEPSPTRSSVLVRLGHSHVRFGSFQRHAHRGDVERLRRLVEFSVEHYAPSAAGSPDLPAALLREVCARSAELCASWMVAGFVHGVLNTDNMNVTGESFDYGPYRFLPVYDPAFVAAYFDETGLYAFGRQPSAVAWNLTRFAEALLPISSEAALQDALEVYESSLLGALHRRFADRLGLAPRGDEDDEALMSACYGFMRESRVGYDRFFFDWYGGAASSERAKRSPDAALYERPSFAPARRAMEPYAPSRPGALSHPYFEGGRPCSMLIDEIEGLWSAIDERDDWAPFEAKVAAVRTMGEALGRAEV